MTRWVLLSGTFLVAALVAGGCGSGAQDAPTTAPGPVAGAKGKSINAQSATFNTNAPNADSVVGSKSK